VGVQIWTDGSCWPNPGPGGWAAVYLNGSQRKELAGGQAETTISRMELMAAIAGVLLLPRDHQGAELFTDSQYVEGIISGRFTRIKKNHVLVATLQLLCSRHAIQVHWIRGHVGYPENERCDQLAAEQREKYTHGR